MLHTKVVLKFPSTNSTIETILCEPNANINAILKDTSRAIHVIASGLSNSSDYKYLSIESIFTFVSNEVFTSVIKSVEIENTIIFDTPLANAHVLKNIDNLTTDVIMSSLLIATIEMSFEVSQGLGFNSSMDSVSEKSIQIAHQIGISSEVTFAVQKWIDIQVNLSFECTNTTPIMDKTLINLTSQMTFGSSANAIIINAIERFRTLFDIDSLTLQDIDSLSMADFDMTI